MPNFGSVQNSMNPWAVFNPWVTPESSPTIETSSNSSRFHIDDAAAAAINPWSVFNPWDAQEDQSTSESSGEGSRFHVSGSAAAGMNPWAVFNPWDTQDNQATMDIHQITQKQIKADPFEALQCQANLGPRRVLNLLKNNITLQINAG